MPCPILSHTRSSTEHLLSLIAAVLDTNPLLQLSPESRQYVHSQLLVMFLHTHCPSPGPPYPLIRWLAPSSVAPIRSLGCVPFSIGSIGSMPLPYVAALP